jgi:outer membrane protein OmpA-like peptidoglycan-associated protein
VNNPESVRPFWTVSGKSDFPDKIVWNGKSSKGELVQSATDYPFVYTVTDNNGVTNTTKGFVQIDVLVIKEGSKLKMQVPSIIFRGDAADFKSDEEVKAMPDWNKISRGLDQRTIENNIRILSRIVEILTKFQDYKVTIEGNASNLTGTKKEEEEVVQLSGERARFVMNWLIQEGISPARLSYVGNGSKYMLVSPSDKENRWKNRRVEFILRK